MLAQSIFRATGIIKGFNIPTGLSGLLPRLGEQIGLGIRLRLPGLGSEEAESKVSEGTYLAAPKKKVSHRKRRQRQLAGNKQVKEILNLNRCPSCGHVKRAHTLCMNCVKEIQRVWKLRDKAASESNTPEGSVYSDKDIPAIDRRVLYPGKRQSAYDKKLKDKEEYLYRRPRTLPYTKSSSSSK
ncbi:mitochondrial 54S ribosomal protein YmL32 [Sugiyamaella lignohabitans]|uniref:Large ribosomal subunit protein bL32m n=1 Tax=Sugiyamaella lignohabitans TaxID=796027 RepID=A0A167FZX3_9ASCO|nr:mitochondrial 54S ribosomal protein YmL32 [Sugiyamaella lignohabitans]ANB15921.1 mitochondrial 54S ribosomal protein YmL32 [Sugiyamaella lignohabitans]